MSCIVELFGELFFELITHCYIKLMQLIVPDKKISDVTKKKIKDTVTTIAVLLFVTLIIGVVLLLPDDPSIRIIGKYMTFIPLSIIVLQIILGIAIKIIYICKNKSSH